MTRTDKTKGKSAKHSSKSKHVMLSIPKVSPTAQSPSTCLITRVDIDKIGRKLDIDDVLENMRKRYKNVDPCTLILKMLPENCIPLGWKLTEILGKGSYGIVLGTRGRMGQFGALKLLHPRDYSTQNNINRECKIGEKFHSMGIGVKVWGCFSFTRGKQKLNALHMSRIDGTVSSYLQGGTLSISKISSLVDNIFDIIARMKREKITHQDFHLSNIGYVHSSGDSSSKLVVIDFGKTTTKKAFVEYDIIKMIICTRKGYTSYSRSSNGTITPANTRIVENLQLFENLVRNKAKKVYDLEFPIDINDMIMYRDLVKEENYDYL